jgi:para-nitrobenzyl esterase
MFGESAGGALVSALVASPEARGLFHRAISQSGTSSGVPMRAMATLAEAEAAGVEVATALGATSLSALRATSAEDVQSMGRGLRPMVDGKYLPRTVDAMYAAGEQHDVDVLLGSNKDEGAFPFFGLNAESAARFSTEARERWGERANAFFDVYPTGSAARDQASQLAAFNDEYAWQMRNWAQLQAKRGNGRAWVYFFTQEPPGAPGQPSRGAMHTAEIPYVFNIPSENWTDADRALAETMSSYWVNFAATGDPNGNGLPVWPRFRDKSSGRAMLLGPRLEPQAPLDGVKLSLYDGLWSRQMRRATGN